MLVEARNQLGGRASSFALGAGGPLIDNCQHVLLGCCEAAAGFLTRIGSLGQVEFFDEAVFTGPAGEEFRIRDSRLPAPVHLLPSIAGTRYLSTREKLGLVRVLAEMVVRGPGKEAAAHRYLRSLRCPESLEMRVFEPILVSALNENLGEASAGYARMVLLKSLLDGRNSYRLGVPRVPLAKLIEEPASRYLAQRGCEIRTSTRAERLNMADGRVESVVIERGEKLESDIYVSAMPPWSLRRIGFGTEAAEHLRWLPIVSAHLFLDTDLPEFGTRCLVGEPFQWVFNKTGEVGLGRGYVQAVASAAERVADLQRDEQIRLALRAVAAAARADMGRIRARDAVIITERRATFSTAHPCDALRPASATPLANLFIAGDWTDTHWPATIESAVRSGQAAAAAVLRAIE